MLLRLGHTLAALRPTLHNGPGWRVGFWVQGCVHRCTANCLSPHLLDPDAGQSFAVDEVVKKIQQVVAAAAIPIEGVTVLGGEPFEQAKAVAAILSPLRASGLSAVVYSGHTLEWLRREQDIGIRSLLQETDVLIDGPFLPALYSDRAAWRGSTNQRLLCLSGRYSLTDLEAAFARQGKGFSIQVRPDGVSVSGLQTHAGVAAVARELGLPVISLENPHSGHWKSEG